MSRFSVGIELQCRVFLKASKLEQKQRGLKQNLKTKINKESTKNIDETKYKFNIKLPNRAVTQKFQLSSKVSLFFHLFNFTAQQESRGL